MPGAQLSTLYTDPESHNTLRHRWTHGQTDRQQYDDNSRSYISRSRHGAGSEFL